jgi:prolyl oligopeptidase
MRLCCLLLVCLMSWSARAEPAASRTPPVAPIHEVKDVYFGKTVIDPYRWMENANDPEMAAWVKGQAEVTRATLAAIPGRAALRRRIEELDRGTTRVNDARRVGGRYFYFKTVPGGSAALVTRDSLDGRERVLVDPNRDSPGGRSHSNIQLYQPSWDGKLVAYGVSSGGSEKAVLHIVEVATGRLLSDEVGECIVCSIAWHPDNKSFFYIRMLSPEEPYRKSRAYQHVLGTDSARDVALYGFGVSATVPFGEYDFPFLQTTPASRWIVAITHHGVQQELTVRATPLSALNGERTPWAPVFEVSDAVTSLDWRGEDLYFRTHSNASRGRILVTSLASPSLSHARELVPSGTGVITDIGLDLDSLYYKVLEGGPSHLRRVATTGGTSAEVPLPDSGAVLAFTTQPLDRGAVIEFTGWIRAPEVLVFDPVKGMTTETTLAPPSSVDFSAVTAEEVQARSADGTLVPLSILHLRKLVRDGSHPALLEGYGSHGISIEPHFSPTRLAWLERGGVLAWAHPRGGGEYGEEWHLEGTRLKKQHTIDDFLACAQFLIDAKYTSSERLGGAGASAGGILIGRAINERPELFAAALSGVSVNNTVRLEAMDSGGANSSELGTIRTPEGFQSLWEMDAYHHVQPGGRHPAMLFTTGINDPRVPIWQVGKMVAKLQAQSERGAPVLMRVDFDAGHGSVESTQSQIDDEYADEQSFLLWQFNDPAFQPHVAPR